jgi:plastocyanin
MKTLFRALPALALVVVALVALGNYTATAQVNGNDNNISVMDDGLPGDPGWNPTGGCTLKRHQGDVPAAEFLALLTSPLTIPPSGALVGHPSWRNEPSHLTAKQGKKVRVTNRGGRGHTFTEVANFGGGFVPPLNVGMTPAPECVNPENPPIPLNPGATIELTAIGPGLHKFECCVHPWMRATIRVE